MRVVLAFIILLSACQQRQPPAEDQTVAKSDSVPEVTPQDAYEKDKTKYTYTEFYGVYDHESTTKGFSAVLTLRQNGNDLYFTASVSQGECKAEIEGVVMMVDHAENYYSGFYESEDCRLQFTLTGTERKIDIKEISLCKMYGENCSFEGTYLKRAD